MNAMNMPGFTAETAIYTNSAKYRMPGSATERNSSAVTPQLGALQGGAGLGAITIEPEQCFTRCFWRCGRYGCYPTNCYEVCL